jgi:hypothetical protein
LDQTTFRRRYAAAAAVLVLAVCSLFSVSYAEPQVVVFYLDREYRPVAKLERLGKVSEGMKAILAMYALQIGGGCEGNDDQGLKCELTKALGLGAQCSKQHLNLVTAWFKREMPSMSGYPEQTIQRVLKSGELGSICYNQPYTATRQQIWEIIRVKTEKNIVSIDAISHWTASADGPSGKNRYSTTYRIDENSVAILNHRKIQ